MVFDSRSILFLMLVIMSEVVFPAQQRLREVNVGSGFEAHQMEGNNPVEIQACIPCRYLNETLIRILF